MNIYRNKKKQCASSLLEYAFVVGIASLFLLSMNTYMKRGLQAKVKYMTDYFIGNEQVAEINKGETISYTKTTQYATLDSQLLDGGATSLVASETKIINATSSVGEGATIATTPSFTQPTGGFVTAPTRNSSSGNGNTTGG
jgi:hypothetical protein